MSLRHLQAPADHGAVLCEPPLDDVGNLIRLNRQRLAGPSAGILGRPWADLQRQGRQAALDVARAYLSAAGEPIPAPCATSLLMAGHQPEFFHPGVWLKNFVLNGLARRHGACAINLIVDNDTVKSTALRIPMLRTGPRVSEEDHESAQLISESTADAIAVAVPFDRWTGAVPYEERPVADEELFAGFAERAAAVFHGWGVSPLLGLFWAEVQHQAERTALLGERLAAARRSFERRWGCHNLEVPVSSLCRTESFAWFACHLLAELPRFQKIHNECLAAYRRRYGVRSRSHPVPELAREGDWIEVPLWAWHPGPSRRGRLLARTGTATVETRIGEEAGPTLAFNSRQPTATISAWQELEERGFKIRSRALTNTLYARLFLADLFVHGLGGAKYDELTDDIIRRFYGFEPPRYLTLTATLRLPLPLFPSRPPNRRALTRELRDVVFNPQRHLGSSVQTDATAQQLIARKQAWIAQQPTDVRARLGRFRALRGLNEQLRGYVADQERQLRQDLARCEDEIRSNAVLTRRDYAFCLYPEGMLRAFLTRSL